MALVGILMGASPRLKIQLVNCAETFNQGRVKERTFVLKTMKRAFNSVNGKAALYAIPLFLTPFSEKLGNLLWEGFWPTYPQLIACSIAGTIATCIGLRAFYDGSYERSKTNETNKN